MLIVSCNWIEDDVDSCPYGFWLKLHYTYNILDVEAAPEYLKDVSVLIYDTDGNYVTQIDVPEYKLKEDNCRVKIEGIPEGDYQFVVWSGMSNSQYAVSGDRTTIGDFRLSLAEQDSAYSAQLPDLYHGYLSDIHYKDEYAIHDVYMTKNTNQLACMIVPVSQQVEIDADDYTMRIVSANDTFDAWNNIVSTDAVTYESFIKDTVVINDPDYGELHGMKFNVSTLKLSEQVDCRLILEKKSTGQKVFNVSLPEYIGMIGSLYTKYGRELTVQEYLDRQDFYTVIFFLSEDLEQLIQLQVNSWRLRANNHLKL